MSLPTIIDTRMHGVEGITAAFVLSGEKTALIETGPMSSFDVLLAGLKANGVERLDWIVVTHIHLDHAGAAGALTRVYPEATVAVHVVGAPHLVDPSKLWESATRIYGDDMERLWGGVEPVPDDRIRALEDGDEVDLGGRRLRAFDTPGHARHHHAFLDDATGALFVGDVLGVRLPDVGLFRPATPPPEFHLEDTVKSIERIRALGAGSLWPTHFGPVSEGISPLTAEEACNGAVESLRTWEEWVREGRKRSHDLDEVTAVMRERARNALEDKSSPKDIERMEKTTSYRMNVSGFMRYLDRSEARS